jgi:hypothetical protein
MPGVFISYRREDSSGYAGRLFDILSVRFGRDNTYMDLDTIKGGDNFEAVIEDKIGQCDALLAVIGERWSTITTDDGRRRLDMPGDFVRLEIGKALARGVRVIPVLVGGASMPRKDDLPEDLRPLCLHQAMDLRDAHFHADSDLLIDLLGQTLPVDNRSQKLKSVRTTAKIAFVAVAALVLAAVPLFRHWSPAGQAPPDAAGQTRVVPIDRPTAKGPTNVAGKWTATVKYDWGDTYTETFNFEVDGSELSGTASLLQHDRAISEGSVVGEQVNFVTRSQTSLGDKVYEETHRYKGTVEGATIRFSMLTDSGAESHVPVHFTAAR